MSEAPFLTGEVDLDALDRFLASDVAPEHCMRISDLDGFLTGVAIGPELIMPSEWLPLGRNGAREAPWRLWRAMSRRRRRAGRGSSFARRSRRQRRLRRGSDRSSRETRAPVAALGAEDVVAVAGERLVTVPDADVGRAVSAVVGDGTPAARGADVAVGGPRRLASRRHPADQ
jgi:hypothetical protein